MSSRKHTRRHRWTAVIGSVASCALLSGCFGSGGSQPAAADHTRHHSPTTESTGPSGSTGSTGPSDPATTVGTSPPPTTGTPASLLTFSPKSNGKHSHACLALHPGDDPAEFLYYPVLIKASSPVSLDSVTTPHSDGIVVAGSWVAPAPQTPSTGMLEGWPPAKIFTQSSNVQWSQRVAAVGATLDPAQGWYNVFLRIQVDPTPGDSTMSGVQVTYHAASGSQTDTWVDHVKFSMSC
jgi:hypothetical protein